jgi:hypothetical protein
MKRNSIITTKDIFYNTIIKYSDTDGDIVKIEVFNKDNEITIETQYISVSEDGALVIIPIDKFIEIFKLVMAESPLGGALFGEVK